ncbi:MAG: PAS domain-containing protein [Pseudomonadota bacterium]
MIENVSTIEEMMDMIDQPMFLLDVDAIGGFTFRRLNRCHQSATGLREGDILGAQPHEVLPRRLADSVVKNYELCRAKAASHTYEELLELPIGARWWQTTLSPIKDASGQVAKIVGLAYDITEHKEQEFALSHKIADLTQLNQNLQVFAASSTRDMAGPFETIGALLSMVQDGFVDLGDEKPGQLALCQDIVEQSILKMADVLRAAEKLQIQQTSREECDFHHMASDIAALLDPHQRLKMHVPNVHVETDRVALQIILRALMENAVRYADCEIAVMVQEDLDQMVAFVISDDGVGQSNLQRCDGSLVLPAENVVGGEFGLASVIGIVRSQGGVVERAHCPYLTGAAIKVTLPGRILH